MGHPNVRGRVIRALEVYNHTGIPISRSPELTPADSPYDFRLFGLMPERDWLYGRIEQRVEAMLAAGLMAEVQGLLNKGYSAELFPMQSLGYRQICDFLAGRYDFAEAVRLIKRDTRHYAKRQLTWFKREQRITWLEVGEGREGPALAEKISNFMAGNQISL